jgi:putative ABC transport system permease protein
VGRLLLICRLAARDLKHRPGTAVLLLLALTAATTALTLGLALHGTTSQPFLQTKQATNGPDVVATSGSPQDAAPLLHAAEVTAHSGPYPYTYVTLKANGRTAGAQVQGRDEQQAPVDQPELTQGTWVRPGEVVLERSFADELGVRAGDQVTLNGRSFRVAGVAVTAASTLLDPHLCYAACDLSTEQLAGKVPGVAWLTRQDATSLATTEPVSYMLDLKLKDPADAPRFASAYDQDQALSVQSWQDISFNASILVRNEQRVMLAGSWLLILLAVAGVAVLVGGRMADQTRRVGLLKAVGSSPGLVAAVLLAEHLVVAVVAAVAGIVAGRLIAPLLTNPGEGLIGAAGPPALGAETAALVVAVALGVAMAATLLPAIRAARASTVAALADASRPPRRGGLLIRVSSRLPVPLLLGLRLIARRPRRALLNIASVTVTASGIVAVLCVHASSGNGRYASAGLDNPVTGKLNQVMLVLTVALVTLAAVNAILMSWATVLDTRHPSALTRALGATPQQVSSGLAAAQVLPAAIGAMLGVPGGIALFGAVDKGGTTVTPATPWLVATVLGTILAVAAVTYLPAWLGTQHPAGRTLAAETK